MRQSFYQLDPRLSLRGFAPSREVDRGLKNDDRTVIHEKGLSYHDGPHCRAVVLNCSSPGTKERLGQSLTGRGVRASRSDPSMHSLDNAYLLAMEPLDSEKLARSTIPSAPTNGSPNQGIDRARMLSMTPRCVMEHRALEALVWRMSTGFRIARRVAACRFGAF